MGSILSRLPSAGERVLFSGREGAVRLDDGTVLSVSAREARRVPDATEPVGNQTPSPDDRVQAVRPRYMDEFPFSFAPLPAARTRLVQLAGVSRQSLPGLSGAKGGVEAAPDGAINPWPWTDGPWSDPATDWAAVFHRLWRASRKDDYIRQDPYSGGAIRVCQALRSTVCAARPPLALSYEMRFGDCEADPEAAYQLKQAVAGMGDAAAMFEVPFVAGDLLCAREVGLRAEVTVRAWPAVDVPPPLPGQALLMLGSPGGDISGSLLLAEFGVAACFPPAIDLLAEARVQEVVRRASTAGMVTSAGACGRGGLLITLAEWCVAGGCGADVIRPAAWSHLADAAVLFAETQSRFVVSLPETRVPDLDGLCAEVGVPVQRLGRTGGSRLRFARAVDLDLTELGR